MWWSAHRLKKTGNREGRGFGFKLYLLVKCLDEKKNINVIQKKLRYDFSLLEVLWLNTN